MTNNAEQFIFAAGHCMGILHKLTDQDLDELEAWAKEVFAPELGHVTALLEVERRRRADRASAMQLMQQ